MSGTMAFSPSLPRELWIKIFRIANASRDIQQFDYAPFSDPGNSYIEDRRILLATAEVRLTLVLVCKLWRSLANELIYEEIRSLVPGEALKEALEKRGKETDTDAGYGPLVRLVELPRHYDYTYEILRHLTRLETLLITFPTSTGSGMLPPRTYAPRPLPDPKPYHEMSHLKRIDWRCDNLTGPPRVDYLEDLLRRAPNLRYLSIIGEDHFNSQRMPFQITLPHLETLIISDLKTSYRLTAVISKWNLPSLSNIVVDRLPLQGQRGLSTIWDSFGETLRVVELGTRFKIFSTVDHVANILSKCPNLTELCIDIVYLCQAPVDVGGSSSSLTTIRLYRGAMYLQETSEIGKSLEKAFRDFYLPSLHKIVLHGDWTFVVSDDVFSGFRQLLRDRRWGLYLESGSHLD